MGLAGPRLDRPSAIGDEGRPRATSLWIATIAVVLIVGGIGYVLDFPQLLPTLATVSGLTVAGIALLERESFASLVVGHLLLVTFGTAVVLLVLVGFIAAIRARQFLAISGCTLGLLGIAMSWADVQHEDVSRAVKGTAMAYLSMFVSALIAAVVFRFVDIGVVTLAGAVGRSDPLLSVVAFLVLVAAAAAGLLTALRWLPVRQLTARSRRERVEDRLDVLRRKLVCVVLGSIGLIVICGGLWHNGVFGPIVQRPVLESLLVVLSSPFVVWPLVTVSLGGALAGLSTIGVRYVSQQISVETNRARVALIVGVSVAVAVTLWIGLLLAWARTGSGRFAQELSTAGVSMAIIPLAGLIATVFGGGCVVLAGKIGLLPNRALGSAIAPTGLLLAAIGLGTGHPVFVFGAITGAALVWDVSTFGLGVTAEVGHLPETRRLELFHGAVAGTVAVGAVFVALGLEAIRTGYFAGIGGTGGTVLIALGALLLLVPLRG